uniref:Transcription factor RelB homolog n=1 Tax=Gallus gallus TaxID=9031 RepID=RELB_CHICK|nr:RecName: Full=Transcription factor RelB homolog [Gallus gallus]
MFAPSLAAFRAMALPIPRLAPVMKSVQPASFPVLGSMAARLSTARGGRGLRAGRRPPGGPKGAAAAEEMAVPIGAALQDPNVGMAPVNDDLEIIEEVMKEDGFQPDPPPPGSPHDPPKLIPRGLGVPVGRRDPPRDPPRLIITEQPKKTGMRFRYECEGRSAGSILGESSTEASKTLPAIELLNCQAIPEVQVTACLVWKDWPHRVHPHGLVGKDCSNGLCQVRLQPHANPRHSFSNLGIQCVKKKEIEAAIEKKLQLGIDPFKAGSLKNHQEVDMNVVRICFQASYRDGSGRTRQLSPVLSEPIFDKKSTNTSELRICRMNKESGPCTGGEELYLLCDKVQKEDIAVVFRKEPWEARADFSQADVHRQGAIVLRTPPYRCVQLSEPVQVEVFLQRLTDRARSRGCPYTYLPRERDAYGVKVKRKRGMPDLLEELSGADPYGIEAKRRKPPPGFMDHFAPLPAADEAFALLADPLDPLSHLPPPSTPQILWGRSYFRTPPPTETPTPPTASWGPICSQGTSEGGGGRTSPRYRPPPPLKWGSQWAPPHQ